MFESIPGGMFGNFEGIKTKGKLRLCVNFDLDMHQPDSLKFDATLTGKDFSIVKYGVTDFRKINGTFSYTAYVNDMPSAPLRSALKIHLTPHLKLFPHT